MEYCKKCGAAIDKKTGCCTNCGLPVENYSKTKGKLVLLIAIAAAIIIVGFLGVKAVMNVIASKMDVATDDGYMEVAEELVDAVYVNLDLEKFASLMPESVIKKLIEEKYDGNEQAYYDELEQVYATMKDKVADPDSVTWKVNEERNVVAAQLDHYEEYYQEQFGTSTKIKYAKALDITISYTSDGEEKEENVYMIIGMIENDWYLIEFTQP